MKKPLPTYYFRWRVVIISLIIGSAICIFIRKKYLPPPAGSGPVNITVKKHLIKNMEFKRDVVIIGVGDSITEGFGSSENMSYFDLIIKNQNSVYPDLEGCDISSVAENIMYSNIAMSCTNSVQHISLQLPLIDKYPAQTTGIVCMTSGGNDLLLNYGKTLPKDGCMYGCSYEHALLWKPLFEQRIHTLIENIQSRFSGRCEIFYGNIYDPTDGVGDIENANVPLPAWPDGLKCLTLWNETIKNICDAYSNVHLVDIHKTFLGHGIHCEDQDNPYYCKDDPHYWYYLNLEDPNDRGYDALRRIFLNTIAEVFSQEIVISRQKIWMTTKNNMIWD